MRTKIVEATQGLNFGKFLVGELDEKEIAHPSSIDVGKSTIRACGFGDVGRWRWVMDLQTREGIFVQFGGVAVNDLNKHQVWVCPMFEPTLVKLYEYGSAPVESLPDLIELPADVGGALYGHRRNAPWSAADCRYLNKRQARGLLVMCHRKHEYPSVVAMPSGWVCIEDGCEDWSSRELPKGSRD